MTQNLNFVKMHGLGNDYIYFNCLDAEVRNVARLSRVLSHRRMGIGGDGVVLIGPSEKCDFSMRIFNADGSEAEMCGNAARCVGKYLFEKGFTTSRSIELETMTRSIKLDLTTNGNKKVKSVCVDLGEPVLRAAEIPVISDKLQIIDEPIYHEGTEFLITCISMGNPHAVVFVDKITDQMVLETGPFFECHSMFPNRTNVEFLRVHSKSELHMRVWERGSGETHACGSGAAAALVAAVVTGRAERKSVIKLIGGDLQIEWSENNHVYKTGPAEIVFEGCISIDEERIRHERQ